LGAIQAPADLDIDDVDIDLDDDKKVSSEKTPAFNFFATGLMPEDPVP
jgi:hypothetical protein